MVDDSAFFFFQAEDGIRDLTVTGVQTCALPITTIGLYWNIKAGGDAALDRTEALLHAKFPGAKFRSYTGSGGWLMRHCTAEDADRIAAVGDAVGGTDARCGACTAMGGPGMGELERRAGP